MYASILAAGALGYALNILFLVVEKRIVHWSGTMSRDSRDRTRPCVPMCRHRAVRARPGRHPHHDPRPDQVLRRLAAVRELRPGHPEAQDRVGVRPQRLRQVDADQHDRRPDPDRQRRDPVRRQVAQGHQDRLRVPELPRGDVPVDAHHRQHRLSAQARRQVEGRGGPAHGTNWWRRSTSSSTSSAIPTSCPVASSRPPRSCARWRRTPRCCSSTSRSRRSTSR